MDLVYLLDYRALFTCLLLLAHERKIKESRRLIRSIPTILLRGVRDACCSDPQISLMSSCCLGRLKEATNAFTVSPPHTKPSIATHVTYRAHP